jgi:hypothetical protein
MMKGLVCTSLLAALVLTCLCLAAPQPSIVPGPGIWMVNTAFTHPQQIMLRRSGSGKPIRYWYMILTLTNKTGRDIDFYPKCDLMTDTFQIIPACKDVPAVVFEQVKKRHQDSYQFLESLENTSNKLLQGEDNAKDIAVIWHDFDAKAGNIKIFIAGLSNETVVIDHPVAKDKLTGKPVKVYLRRTLELSYDLGSDPAFRSGSNLAYKDKRWVMR